MRKSGQSAGLRGWPGSGGLAKGWLGGVGRTLRPKRRSHSGPERYVIVAISGRRVSVRLLEASSTVLTACELHASVWGETVVVEAVVPVGIGHENWACVRGCYVVARKRYSPLRWAKRIAIADGLLLAVPLMLMTLPTRSG